MFMASERTWTITKNLVHNKAMKEDYMCCIWNGVRMKTLSVVALCFTAWPLRVARVDRKQD